MTRGYLIAALAVAAAACEADPGGPEGPVHFGQVGWMEVRTSTPLALGEGSLEQTLRWASSGAWILEERISYLGVPGDEVAVRSRGNPANFAQEYAALVMQLNETRGLQLFVPELDPNLNPSCAGGRSRWIFRIRDDWREEDVEWTRCADGSLFSATPGGAGPDPNASRIVVAGQLARFFTVGEEARSAYRGSVPFGTLDRGEHSPVRLERPRAFFVPEGEPPDPPGEWLQFWEQHTGGGRAPPDVDWRREMVIVAAVGERLEAGDSVAVRRILQVESGTNVEVVERSPGDFCSPAARRQHPYHVVVAPRTPPQIRFAEIRVERVPCGP